MGFWSGTDDILGGANIGASFAPPPPPPPPPAPSVPNFSVDAAASRRLRNNVSSGGSNGGFFSNSYGGYSAPSGPPPSVPGPIPSIDTFLNQDPTYQQQLRDYSNSLTNFLADVTRRRGSTETDYGTSQKALSDQRDIDLNNLLQDYGSRGLLRSGLYGKALGDYNTEYDKRQSDLSTREQDALSALQQQQTQYQTQNDLQQQAAREDAIRRRASQYGI